MVNWRIKCWYDPIASRADIATRNYSILCCCLVQFSEWATLKSPQSCKKFPTDCTPFSLLYSNNFALLPRCCRASFNLCTTESWIYYHNFGVKFNKTWKYFSLLLIIPTNREIWGLKTSNTLCIMSEFTLLGDDIFMQDSDLSCKKKSYKREH